ncbi:MAG: C4-dicarboxylate ABC transporter permease [Vulcanisaeta sp.]|nr:C4-dicarboxylate ABC transporter permease [Vulcanisaeta sp.]
MLSKLLILAIILAVVTYTALLSSLAGTYLPSKGSLSLDVFMLSLAVVSFFTSFLAIKQTWYDVSTAYTDRELIIGRLERILAFFALGLNIVNIILVFAYILIVAI